MRRNSRWLTGFSILGALVGVVFTLIGSSSRGVAAIRDPAVDRQRSGDAVGYRNCDPVQGWSEIARREPRYVVFGEMHGTSEAPQLVQRLACHLAKAGRNVLVAVELDASDNPSLQQAWNGARAAFLPQLLKSGWKDRDDGVASVAMMRMLDQLHGERVIGRRISVVAFNGFKDASQEGRFGHLPGQEPHEAAQAENIAQAAAQGDYDDVIVLVGNAHARRKAIALGESAYRPMAVFLAETGRVISLNMLTSGGTSWDCTMKPGAKPASGAAPSGVVECGSHPMKGMAANIRPPVMGLGGFSSFKADPDYDGYFWLGGVSSSPPAVP